MSEKLRSYFLLGTLIFLIAVPVTWITRFVYRLCCNSRPIDSPDNIFLRLKHLGLIMDGNRRWAHAHNYGNEVGYKEGGERLWEIVQVCVEEGVENLTAYALSLDNIRKRNNDELDHIFDIALKAIEDRQKWLINQGVRVQIVGERSLFPEKIIQRLTSLEEATKNGRTLTIYVLMGYDPINDIFHSIKKIATDVKNGSLKEESLEINTVLNTIQSSNVPPIDLIIRTGGHERLSGFLPLQSIYAEFVFLPYMWPDINKEDVRKIIRNFFMRTRNFGK